MVQGIPLPGEMADEQPTPAEQTQRLYEDAEARTAKAFEDLVAQESFGELLAKVAGNAIAVMKLGSDAADLVVGNLRLAGRQDVISLHNQLARTEDKLERLLQEIERLQDELREAREVAASNSADGERGAAPKRRRTGGGSKSGR